MPVAFINDPGRQVVPATTASLRAVNSDTNVTNVTNDYSTTGTGTRSRAERDGSVYSAAPVRWRLPFKDKMQNVRCEKYAPPKEAAKLLESSALQASMLKAMIQSASWAMFPTTGCPDHFAQREKDLGSKSPCNLSERPFLSPLSPLPLLPYRPNAVVSRRFAIAGLFPLLIFCCIFRCCNWHRAAMKDSNHENCEHGVHAKGRHRCTWTCIQAKVLDPACRAYPGKGLQLLICDIDKDIGP